MALEGHCLCGSITYVSTAEPVLTGVCHCTDCQRQTGSAGSIVVAVPTNSLEVRGDTLKTYATIGDEHGTKTNRQFCSECGSPIVSRIDAMPDLVFIKAGTLDDTSWLNPTAEFFRRSAQPWDTPMAGATQYEGGPS